VPALVLLLDQLLRLHAADRARARPTSAPSRTGSCSPTRPSGPG
jgi:hypothetical protein